MFCALWRAVGTYGRCWCIHSPVSVWLACLTTYSFVECSKVEKHSVLRSLTDWINPHDLWQPVGLSITSWSRSLTLIRSPSRCPHVWKHLLLRTNPQRRWHYTIFEFIGYGSLWGDWKGLVNVPWNNICHITYDVTIFGCHMTPCSPFKCCLLWHDTLIPDVEVAHWEDICCTRAHGNIAYSSFISSQVQLHLPNELNNLLKAGSLEYQVIPLCHLVLLSATYPYACTFVWKNARHQLRDSSLW